MDRLPSRIKRAIAIGLLPAAMLPAWAANPLETIDVLCGGAEAEERERLGAEVIGATLALEFLTEEMGRHVGDVDVLFTPLTAPVSAFGIVASAGVCYIELPPGEYRIDTWFNGHARSLRAMVAAAPGTPMGLMVRFPEDPGKDLLLSPPSPDAPHGAHPSAGGPLLTPVSAQAPAQ